MTSFLKKLLFVVYVLISILGVLITTTFIWLVLSLISDVIVKPGYISGVEYFINFISLIFLIKSSYEMFKKLKEINNETRTF